MSRNRQKTASVTVKITPELRAAIEARAAAEHRTVSAYLDLVLTRLFEEKGAEPKRDSETG